MLSRCYVMFNYQCIDVNVYDVVQYESILRCSLTMHCVSAYETHIHELSASVFSLNLVKNTMLVTSRSTMLRKFILFLVCFSALIWQVYYISYDYFEYSTMTQVIIKSPSKFYLPPKIAIGFTKRCLFNDTQKITEHVFGPMNIPYHIDRQWLALPEPRDLIKQVFVHSRAHDELIKSDELIFEKYLIDQTVFYSIALPHNYSVSKDMLRRSKCFYTIVFNPMKLLNCRGLQFSIFPPKLSHYGFDEVVSNHKFMVNDTSTINMFATYHYYRSTLLESPYETHCTNYSKLNFESQDHCKHACFTNSLHKELNHADLKLIIKSPADVRQLQLNPKSNQHEIDEIRTRCNQRCYKPDCFQELYIPVVLESILREGMTFDIRVPSTPYIVTIFKPLIPTIDFITYILSCFSFWLGVSPFSFFSNCKWFNPSSRSARSRHRAKRRTRKVRPIKLTSIVNDENQLNPNVYESQLGCDKKVVTRKDKVMLMFPSVFNRVA